MTRVCMAGLARCDVAHLLTRHKTGKTNYRIAPEPLRSLLYPRGGCSLD